ncbi:MAG: hypothetical protein J2P36_36785 [Ktedonobacteraceae bacterium]|nr:hypothetical protein [Ktedonobacteraceae bacterium]
MRRKWVLITLFGLGILAYVVSGCGAAQGNGGKATPGSTPTGSSATPTQSLQGVPTPSQPTPRPSTTATGPRGAVTLQLSKSHYSPGDPIEVTIANGLSTPVSALDHQSACSVITLQMQVGGTWQVRSPCLLRTATRPVGIAAGTSLHQSLPPSAGTFANKGSWPPGSYRLVFSYMPGTPASLERTGTQPFKVIYSSPFTIS